MTVRDALVFAFGPDEHAPPMRWFLPIAIVPLLPAAALVALRLGRRLGGY